MKLSIQAGSTSQSINIFIQNNSVTTGAGLSGLVFNTSGLTAYYSFTGASATSTAISLATLATVTTAWATGGFIQIDATNMTGWYRFDIPNAVLAASNGRSVSIHFQGRGQHGSMSDRNRVDRVEQSGRGSRRDERSPERCGFGLGRSSHGWHRIGPDQSDVGRSRHPDNQDPDGNVFRWRHSRTVRRHGNGRPGCRRIRPRDPSANAIRSDDSDCDDGDEPTHRGPDRNGRLSGHDGR